MKVSDLITRAVRLLGASNIGDPLPAPELQNGLLALNALLDAWGAQRLTMFTSARIVQTISANVQQYSLGPTVTGTDWVMARPPVLDGAGLIISGGYERPLGVIRTDGEWAAVRLKGLTSTLPTAIYYQPDFPNGTAVLWPAPQLAQQIALYVPVAISQFVSTNDTVSLPPSYARCLAYNLALELAAEYDRTPSDAVVGIAMQSLEQLKAKNCATSIGMRRAAEEFCGNGRSGNWDYLIGESR